MDDEDSLGYNTLQDCDVFDNILPMVSRYTLAMCLNIILFSAQCNYFTTSSPNRYFFVGGKALRKIHLFLQTACVTTGCEGPSIFYARNDYP